MVTRSGQRSAFIAVFFAVLMVFGATNASAQSSINFNGGASIDPKQVYAGVSWESPDIGGRFRIRPGIDGGFGDGLRLGTINIDLIVKFPLGTSAWTLIQGGGPTISVAKFTGAIRGWSRASFTPVAATCSAFNTTTASSPSFRVGGGGFVPQLKLGVGWAVEIK